MGKYVHVQKLSEKCSQTIIIKETLFTVASYVHTLSLSMIVLNIGIDKKYMASHAWEITFLLNTGHISINWYKQIRQKKGQGAEALPEFMKRG